MYLLNGFSVFIILPGDSDGGKSEGPERPAARPSAKVKELSGENPRQDLSS